MTRRRLLWAWAILSLIWIGVIVYVCLAAWPSMPLDLGNDAATRAAFSRAVTAYAVRCALIALLPPLLLLAIGWLAARLTGSRP